MGLQGRKLELAQTFLVVLPSFVLFAYNQSGLGGLLSVESWVETFPQIDTINTTGSQKSYNSTIQGVVVATCTLGALFGSLACSWLGDPLGRRKTILLAATLTFIGEVLECTSFQLAQFIVGRFILGLGVGGISTTVPVWQSECSRAKNRGQHVIVDGIFLCLGYVLQAWINLAFYQIKGSSLAWRMPLAIPAIISLVLMGSIYLIPESPRWLAQKAGMEKARNSLALFRGRDPESFEVSNELAAIELALEESTKTAKKRDLFTMGPQKNFYRFALAIVLQFCQQWCGSNLISSYSTTIFQESLNLSSETARVLSGACLTWKFLSAFAAFFTIDRFGRRKLFMFSGAGMSLCMTALTIASSMPKSDKSAQYASVFFVFLFNFFTPIGFMGCNYLYVTEVAPTSLRMAMTSFSMANHWTWNFAVLMITPIALESIGYQYYIIYAVIGACIPILVFFFYPETMSRSLEQMDELFQNHSSPFAIVRASLWPHINRLEQLSDEVDEKEKALQIEEKA